MAESILAMLLQEGVTLDGKEEQLKNKMQGDFGGFECPRD